MNNFRDFNWFYGFETDLIELFEVAKLCVENCLKLDLFDVAKTCYFVGLHCLNSYDEFFVYEIMFEVENLGQKCCSKYGE